MLRSIVVFYNFVKNNLPHSKPVRLAAATTPLRRRGRHVVARTGATRPQARGHPRRRILRRAALGLRRTLDLEEIAVSPVARERVQLRRRPGSTRFSTMRPWLQVAAVDDDDLRRLLHPAGPSGNRAQQTKLAMAAARKAWRLRDTICRQAGDLAANAKPSQESTGIAPVLMLLRPVVSPTGQTAVVPVTFRRILRVHRARCGGSAVAVGEPTCSARPRYPPESGTLPPRTRLRCNRSRQPRPSPARRRKNSGAFPASLRELLGELQNGAGRGLLHLRGHGDSLGDVGERDADLHHRGHVVAQAGLADGADQPRRERGDASAAIDAGHGSGTGVGGSRGGAAWLKGMFMEVSVVF